MLYFRVPEIAVRSDFGMKPQPPEFFVASAQLQVPDGYSMITTTRAHESSVLVFDDFTFRICCVKVRLVMPRLAASMPLKRGDYTVITSCLDGVPSELWRRRGGDITSRI